MARRSSNRLALGEGTRVMRAGGGGYDCELVTPSPDAVQSECPVCLQILKEPCLISCPCGQKFCRECVERIKRDGKPCPVCNNGDFSFMRDHGLERYLRQQDVWCFYKKDGCCWKGKLGAYEQHLNEEPSAKNMLDGCPVVELMCVKGCDMVCQRQYMSKHENEECPKRLLSCQYCNEYDCTFDFMTIHYEVCKKYPVICPNNCQSNTFERHDIEAHIANLCPLTEVQCPLHYAGCVVKLPRKDIEKHMKDAATHLTLLAAVTQSLLTENQQLKHSVQELSNRFDKLEDEAHRLRQSIGFPINFNVKYPNKEENVYLPSFYTHSRGYQLCIWVDLNGYGDGKGTHISIFSCLMKGPYDDHLKWPFRGDITIQIVNQLRDHSHAEKTIYFHDKTPDTYAARVTDRERAERAWGKHKFLPFDDLKYNAKNKTQYLKDGIIIVRITRVTIR